MAINQGSRLRTAYIAETTWGTTPATPTFKNLRLNRNSLRGNKGTATSDEIRDDRNVVDEIVLSRSAGGSIEAEFSYGSFDDLIEACLMGTWTTNVLKVGSTLRSFTIEETSEVGSANPRYARFPGMMVDTWSLEAPAREKMMTTFGFLGKKEDHATGHTLITGATYTAVNTEKIIPTSGSLVIGSFTGTAVTLAAPKVLSFSLNVNNNLAERPVVDDEYSLQPRVGKCDVTGEITIYFEDKSHYEIVDRHDLGALSVTIGFEANKKYTLLLPRLRYGDGERIGKSLNDDIKVRIPFRGTYDNTEATSLKITRAVA
jgi:hypothetical protein